MKKTLLIFLILTSFNEGCKKYEDGPVFSLRSAKYRFDGYHTLIKYTVDGIDSLNSYYDSLGLMFRFIHNDDNGANICIMNGISKDGNMSDFYWGWELTNHNRICKVLGSGGASNGIGVFKGSITPEWEILKLGKKEIKMKTNYNEKEYIIELDRN